MPALKVIECEWLRVHGFSGFQLRVGDWGCEVRIRRARDCRVLGVQDFKALSLNPNPPNPKPPNPKAQTLVEDFGFRLGMI